MKGLLEFNLPDDEESFYYAQNGILYCIVLEDLDIWLRNKAKYEDQETISIAEVREYLSQLREERDLR